MHCMQMLAFVFQSTLPRGERPNLQTAISSQVYFNPRSREGSDRPKVPPQQRNWGFQSTLPRGERRLFLSSSRNSSYISIHAPARGATAVGVIVAYNFTISIHAPARGATRLIEKSSLFPGYFNPRSREGSD